MRKNSTVYKLETRVVKHHNGHYCGYVGVPQSHPLYGFTLYELDETRDFCPDVYRGLSYSSDEYPSYYTNELPKLNYWWLGFDQAAFPSNPNAYVISKDEGYCTLNVHKLLSQVRYYEQYGTLESYEDQGRSYWQNPLGPEEEDENNEECWWPDGN